MVLRLLSGSLRAATIQNSLRRPTTLLSWRVGGQVRNLSSNLPSHTTLTLPALSPTMTEGTIASWLKEEGDAVEAGQPICEIETDKATVDYEVQDDGYLAKILVEAGASHPIGQVIGVLVEDKEDIQAFANITAAELSEGEPGMPASGSEQPEPTPAPTTPTPQTDNNTNTPPQQPLVTPKSDDGSRVIASPLARLIARENGIDLSTSGIQGTGPSGRIVRTDIESFIENGGGAATVEEQSTGGAILSGTSSMGGNYFDTPVAADAQTLAHQLEQSKHQVPHYYLNSEIDLGELLKLRNDLNSNLPQDSQVSINDFFVKASALCMTRVPDANASWGQTFIRRYQDTDINVAIINENEDAILMPVIKCANTKGLSAISQESREFVTKPEAELDYSTGTFTISNMGAYGLKSFTPIIRAPQAASLGIGKIGKRAVPGDVDEQGNPTVKVQTYVTVTLSCDHRVIDGAVGAAWLQEFKQLLQNPINMLL